MQKKKIMKKFTSTSKQDTSCQNITSFHRPVPALLQVDGFGYLQCAPWNATLFAFHSFSNEYSTLIPSQQSAFCATQRTHTRSSTRPLSIQLVNVTLETSSGRGNTLWGLARLRGTLLPGKRCFSFPPAMLSLRQIGTNF